MRFVCIALMALTLAACNGGPTCDQLKKAMDAACAIDENSQACQIAAAQWEKKCGVKPTPTPTVEPTTEPTVPPIDCRVTLCPPGKHCVEGIGCVPDVEPTPPPVVSCHPAPEDPGWGKPISPSARPSMMFNEYLVVVRTLPDSCGQAAPDEKPQKATLDRIAEKWRELFPGRCVSSPGDWGGVGDSVSVRAPDGIYEEIHAVYFGNGCTLVTEGAYKNGWPCTGCSGGVEPTPLPPTPPPTGACPSPVPPKVGKFNLKPHNRWYDSTPLFYEREALRWDGTMSDGFCSAIGFTGSDSRLWCPARQEGDPNRVPCEAVGVGGSSSSVPLWRCEVGAPEVSDNPYQARCNEGTWIEVCAADGTACQRASL